MQFAHVLALCFGSGELFKLKIAIIQTCEQISAESEQISNKTVHRSIHTVLDTLQTTSSNTKTYLISCFQTELKANHQKTHIVVDQLRNVVESRIDK